MRLVYSLGEIDKSVLPIFLTIGNFDGLHLGHQAVLEHVIQKAKQQQTLTSVLTFSNHPSTILSPMNPIPLLCSTEHKIQLLEQASIDLVILLPFTKEFSEQAPDIFLRKVKQSLPFQTLILGSDAHIGKNREGNQSTLKALAQTLGFTLEYFPDFTKNDRRISSSLIREQIQKGQLKQAEFFLGRPYSIYGSVLTGNGRGASLGFPTANLAVEGLCLPPFGVYAVSLLLNDQTFRGIANLGLAPTVRPEGDPILEVHLFNRQIDLYGKMVDVRFHEFIRPEKRFQDVEDLRKQIAQDILSAKNIHHIAMF
jgi:riboflavin kinase / FMN adenylyltransferase